MKRIKVWIEAMRLRTLPVGASCVIAGVALAVMHGSWRWQPAVICLAFALLAQIASNFANEYYDFRAGIDSPGRQGPRRGVTEGDITPRAMLTATLATLGLAAAIGCSLIYWGGWLMIPCGVIIGLFALAYSAGPYPLSRHGLGSVAVIVFFGLVPVTLTYYLQTGRLAAESAVLGLAVGALACNILLINNYRDINEDRAAGKRTDVVIFGRRAARTAYVANGICAVVLTLGLWHRAGWWTLVFPALYLAAMLALHRQMARRNGQRLNPILGLTAMSELFFCVSLLAAAAMSR